MHIIRRAREIHLSGLLTLNKDRSTADDQSNTASVSFHGVQIAHFSKNQHNPEDESSQLIAKLKKVWRKWVGERFFLFLSTWNSSIIRFPTCRKIQRIKCYTHL
jgi:hypothetical protein